MKVGTIKSLIAQGEGINIEFKKCRGKVNKDTYKTISAFLNRGGGHLLLGVEDNGNISGIEPKALGDIKKSLVTTLNNLEKMNPPLYAIPEEILIDDKTILCLFVPESSAVHQCSGRIYDRNEDGDLDITRIKNCCAALNFIKKISLQAKKALR